MFVKIHVVVHYTSFYLSKVWRSQILHPWIYIIIDASCVDANIINSSSIDASIIIFCIHILVIVIIIDRYYWYTLCRFRLGSVQIWVRLYFMIILKSDQLLSDQNLSEIRWWENTEQDFTVWFKKLNSVIYTFPYGVLTLTVWCSAFGDKHMISLFCDPAA